jgi:hypothetical protein
MRATECNDRTKLEVFTRRQRTECQQRRARAASARSPTIRKTNERTHQGGLQTFLTSDTCMCAQSALLSPVQMAPHRCVFHYRQKRNENHQKRHLNRERTREARQRTPGCRRTWHARARTAAAPATRAPSDPRPSLDAARNTVIGYVVCVVALDELAQHRVSTSVVSGLTRNMP